MVEQYAQLYFAYLKIGAKENTGLSSTFIDIFGNQITCEKRRITDGRYISRSLNPLNFSTSLLFNKQISSSGFLLSNLGQLSLRVCPSPLECHLDLLSQAFSLKRLFAVTNYFEGGQFWGYQIRDSPLEGKLYPNEEDYNTISDKPVHYGRIAFGAQKLKYEGFFKQAMPNYRGSYYINDVLVYEGEIKDGVPDGKGRIYSSKGVALFEGLVNEGFPSTGTYYKLPRIFSGRFLIPNMSNYKFSYKKIDLLTKSMKYEEMMLSFSLEGEIYNYAPDVKVLKGFFPCEQLTLLGDFLLKSKDGKIYIGGMKDSLKEGMGILLMPSGHSMVGLWNGGQFSGVFRNPPSKGLNASKQLERGNSSGRIATPKNTVHRNYETHSKIGSVRQSISFSKEPDEVRGTFRITGDKLILDKCGVIKFEDGTYYTGGISNNKMHGYGALNYASGETYEGTWVSNQMTGIGTYTTDKFSFRGQFKKGKWHGYGLLSFGTSVVKEGEWDNGHLKYALIDSYPSNNNYLQVEHQMLAIKEDTLFTKTLKLNLVGYSHVIFKEVEADQENLDDSELKSPGIEFFGEFQHQPEDFEGFRKGEIVGVGYIIRNTEVIFKGIVDSKFSNFFGVKYDYINGLEMKGQFSASFKLNGYASVDNGNSVMEGYYKKNRRNGLFMKRRVNELTIGEYEDDKKHGSFIESGKQNRVLKEYAYGKLKKVYLGDAED